MRINFGELDAHTNEVRDCFLHELGHGVCGTYEVHLRGRSQVFSDSLVCEFLDGTVSSREQEI